MKHALKYLVLSTLIFSCGAGTMKLICTPKAGAGQTSSMSEHSLDPPAIYFYDKDGNRMTPKEAQEMLIALDYRDNEGNVIVADGAPGTSTWQGWCKYTGDCHGNDVMDLFEVR